MSIYCALPIFHPVMENNKCFCYTCLYYSRVMTLSLLEANQLLFDFCLKFNITNWTISLVCLFILNFKHFLFHLFAALMWMLVLTPKWLVVGDIRLGVMEDQMVPSPKLAEKLLKKIFIVGENRLVVL